MRVLVVGATGRTGRPLIKGALEQGHEVTAFARDPSKIEARHDRLRVARGDVLDAASVDKAVAGQEAVLSTLAQPRARMRTTLVSDGTKNVVAAMEGHGVRRFVCVTVLGAGDSKRHASFFYNRVASPFFLDRVLEDKERQEEVIRRSSLDWVMVRPPRLTDKPPRGDYRVLVDEPGVVSEISRADLADFVLTQLEDDRYLRRAPAVGY